MSTDQATTDQAPDEFHYEVEWLDGLGGIVAFTLRTGVVPAVHEREDERLVEVMVPGGGIVATINRDRFLASCRLRGPAPEPTETAAR